MKNLIVFVKVEDQVTAVWPFEKWSQDYLQSYAHVGQHGGISPDFLQPEHWVKDHSYIGLLEELEKVGYSDLVVLNDTSGYNSEIYPYIQKAYEDWTRFGILDEKGNLCSKTKFSNILDWHQYGTGRNKRYIGFAYSNAKESLWGWYNTSGLNKKGCIDHSYERTKALVGGNLYAFGEGIQWTNKGIPLTSRRMMSYSL